MSTLKKITPEVVHSALNSILENERIRVTRKISRLEANLKASRLQLKSIADLISDGSTKLTP